MKGLFIDASVTELKKNYVSIADYFKERDDSFEAVFMTVDTASFVVREMETAAYNHLNEKGYVVEHFKSFNRRIIKKRIEGLMPDYVFIDSMNVYNQLWNALCKEMKIPVYFYPHGFQIDNLFYKKTEVFRKVIKVARYTYGLYNIAKLIKKPFKSLFKSYSNYISNGADMRGTALDDPRLYPDVVFIFSEYYKEFWERKYGIKNVKYEYIMPYDFTMVEQILSKSEEVNAACYITQTLHEDGRYTKDQYYELLLSLRPVATAVDKLYIKLHPRVDSAMYDKAFDGIPNVVITRDFPHCKCYFTHYSSMAYTSALVSGNTIIYELPGQPTHEVYREVATEIVYDEKELINALTRLMKKEEKPFEERKQIISKYATYTGISPFKVLYETIYKISN